MFKYILFIALYLVWIFGTNLSSSSDIFYFIQILLSMCLFAYLILYNINYTKSIIYYVLLFLGFPLFLYNFHRILYLFN